MYRGLSIAFAAVCLVFPAAAVPASPSALRADVDRYFAELERIHPDPYHATSRETMRAAADGIVARADSLGDDQVMVELMRLVALLGERDGHAGLFPFDSHRRTMHAYPFWTYLFSDGVFVVATAGGARVGERLVAVEGRPVDDVLAAIEPVQTRDNGWSRRNLAPMFLASAEVLHGLGVTPTAERATFTLASRTGVRRNVTLEARPFAAARSALRPRFRQYVFGLPQQAKPLFLSHLNSSRWLTTLDRGRVVYVSYNLTLGGTFDFSDRLLRAARKPRVRRIVIDLRNNPGGEIRTYAPLLSALTARAINRPGRLVLLIGRTTFSAAVHFTADVQMLTRARLVGEPTGGAPNHWSDTDPVHLENTGLIVRIPAVYFEKRPDRNLDAIEPDERVDLTAAAYFGKRDPVLHAALR